MSKRSKTTVDILTVQVGTELTLEQLNTILTTYRKTFAFLEEQDWFLEHRDEVMEYIHDIIGAK